MIAYIIPVITIVIAIIKFMVDIFIGINNRKRDVRKDTIFKCEYFQSQIVPSYLNLIKFHDKNKINFFKNVYFDKDTGILNKPYALSPKYSEFLEKAMLLFNEMDSFAAFINDKTLADSEIAYKIQGKAFCDIIIKLKVVYDIFLTTNKDDYYCLEQLFNSWIKQYSPSNIIVNYNVNCDN